MICLDTNIVLELLLERQRADLCREYVATSIDDLALTPITVSTVMYYAEGKHLDLPSTERVLRSFTWLTTVEADVTWAFEHYAGHDFEDALQVACALREVCSEFVTLDKGLAQKYAAVLSVRLLG
jgi:predicted nucleic acid-binding protein